ncbi:ATP-grasp domain-containing protein [Ramlibacter sp. WS9]|nr:ATP-grasp domain-containing protein [Ramlibacter sp. WS9]
MARSLKRAGFQVWLVADETRCASFSSAVQKVIHWGGANHPQAIDELEGIARANALAGSILIPSADPEVRLVSQAHERLSSLFVVMTSDWEHLRWACDKALAYQRAKDLGLGVPRVYAHASFDDPNLKELQFPLVLKPSMRLRENRLTADRGWRVDDRDGFKERYKTACELVGAEHVIAQQMIPGDGEHQQSYAGLWDSGEPVVSLTARRLRQYPVEFGSTSTYVVTAHLPEAAAAAETFLRSIRHHGLVEAEFKHDPRDGILKLLDVNPRPWNWLGLAGAAGIDFGAAISCVASNRPVPKADVREGVAWIFVARDLVAAAQSGRLRPRAILGYAATWARVRRFACLSWTDPLPGIVDLPATFARMLYRRGKRPGALGAGAGIRH